MENYQRMNVPERFTSSIASWLKNLTRSSYQFLPSPIYNNSRRCFICIGDIHADPRGFTSALYISDCIDREGNWIG